MIGVRINRNILECKADLVVMNGRKHLVLIETYWNVKCIGSAPSIDGLGINRNILECKENRRVGNLPSVPGINRNILECKGI